MQQDWVCSSGILISLSINLAASVPISNISASITEESIQELLALRFVHLRDVLFPHPGDCLQGRARCQMVLDMSRADVRNYLEREEEING